MSSEKLEIVIAMQDSLPRKVYFTLLQACMSYAGLLGFGIWYSLEDGDFVLFDAFGNEYKAAPELIYKYLIRQCQRFLPESV